MIYMDNNATTIMSAPVLKAMLEWSNRGNPSAGYAAARDCRRMMTEFRRYIAQLCGIDVCCEEERDTGRAQVAAPKQYRVIFTSGASEANCMLIRGVIDSYSASYSVIPHVVCSAIEHKSIMMLLKSLEEMGHVTVTYVEPTVTGHIAPSAVDAAIRKNTCLVVVMHANNETGAINDVAAIGRVAHAKNVPLHTDTVQTFGKMPLNPGQDIDSFVISFHKIYGPPGVGALIIRQRFLAGFRIKPLIYGTQNEGLRGGTENVPGIGAAFAALRLTMDGRARKNAHLLSLKKRLMSEFAKLLPTISYAEYVKTRNDGGPKKELEMVFISGDGAGYLPNTIMLSIVKRSKPYICNTRIKNALEARGIIVSIGSACNTASSKASHVLYAMGADELIRKGALRISLGDSNTEADVLTFVREFMAALKGEVA